MSESELARYAAHLGIPRILVDAARFDHVLAELVRVQTSDELPQEQCEPLAAAKAVGW